MAAERPGLDFERDIRPDSHLRRATLIKQRGTRNHERDQQGTRHGCSGLLGVAAIEKFLSAGWEVVGVSRRKPELPSGRDIEFLSVDLRDKQSARLAFERLTDITHIAYTALHEKPRVGGWLVEQGTD